MKKILAAAGVAAALGLGLVTLTGFAGGCGAHRHSRDPAQMAAFVTEHVDDALDDLDATPDQRTRIHAIKDRLLEEGRKVHGARREVHDVVVGEWKAEQPDAARLHALVDARIDALRAFAHQAVDAGAEAHGVLTPAQREKVTKKMERHHR